MHASLFLLLGLLCRPAFADRASLRPLPALDATTLAEVKRGQATFNHFYSAREGLGPVFASNSCVACHTGGGRGPIVIEKLAAVEEDGHTPAADQAAYLPYGPNVRPFAAYPAKVGVKRDAGLAREGKKLFTAIRMPPAMFGRGYLEAVAESEILAQESKQASLAGPIKGRVNRLGNGQAGRFGLKARIASLDDFNADAFVSDMGLTTPLRPVGLPNPEGIADPAEPEVSEQSNHEVSQFIRYLAIERKKPSPAGEKLFRRVDCATCHVPSLAVDPASELGQRGFRWAPVFTDLLVHDMGAALADGQAEEGAGSRDWRTAPLVQLRHQTSFLHDGRAGSVERAIELHGAKDAESFASYEKFRALPERERRALVDFVKGL